MGLVPTIFTSTISFYETAGLVYFPLKFGTKVPAVSAGFRSSETEISNKLAELANYNLAIICGERSRNLVVLDFECESDAWIFFDRQKILKETLCVRSAHSGIHVYLRTLDQCPSRRTKIAGTMHPFDLLGEGGYVVAAPSTIDHAKCDPSKTICPSRGSLHTRL